MNAPVEIKWKAGSRISTDPEVAYRELEKIRAKHHGEIPLEAVVKAAKPKNSPLHKEFLWDDAAAAEKYRLEQARYIVRSIEVVRVEAPNVQSRAYESVMTVADKPEDTPQRAYRKTEDILADPVARADLLTAFIRDIQALRRRYAALSELALVWRAVDEAVDQVAAKVM